MEVPVSFDTARPSDQTSLFLPFNPSLQSAVRFKKVESGLNDRALHAPNRCNFSADFGGLIGQKRRPEKAAITRIDAAIITEEISKIDYWTHRRER